MNQDKETRNFSLSAKSNTLAFTFLSKYASLNKYLQHYFIVIYSQIQKKTAWKVNPGLLDLLCHISSFGDNSVALGNKYCFFSSFSLPNNEKDFV